MSRFLRLETSEPASDQETNPDPDPFYRQNSGGSSSEKAIASSSDAESAVVGSTAVESADPQSVDKATDGSVSSTSSELPATMDASPCGSDGGPRVGEPQLDCSEDPAPIGGSRSYRANPGAFMAALQSRADSLFACGYRVRAARLPYLFIVIPPLGRAPILLSLETGRACPTGGHAPDGYMVNPAMGTCTCPFFARQQRGDTLTNDGTILPCKHLVGLEKLVMDVVNQCKQSRSEAALYRMFRLLSQWMDVLASQYRPREAKRPVLRSELSFVRSGFAAWNAGGGDHDSDEGDAGISSGRKGSHDRQHRSERQEWNRKEVSRNGTYN